MRRVAFSDQDRGWGRLLLRFASLARLTTLPGTMPSVVLDASAAVELLLRLAQAPDLGVGVILVQP